MWHGRKPLVGSPKAMVLEKHILHVVLMNLSATPADPSVDCGDGAVRFILAAFGRLADIEGVLHVGAVRAAGAASTHSLATFAVLRDAAALEEFGTHHRHIEYLRSAVLPRISDLVTADVAVAECPPPSYHAAACFCAGFQPTTYDWEVRSLFNGATEGTGNTTIGGLATDDRQRFRAAGLAFWPNPDDWSSADQSESLRRQWRDCWGRIATDEAWVVGPATPVNASARGAVL